MGECLDPKVQIFGEDRHVAFLNAGLPVAGAGPKWRNSSNKPNVKKSEGLNQLNQCE
jgi:hypothetical protein